MSRVLAHTTTFSKTIVRKALALGPPAHYCMGMKTTTKTAGKKKTKQTAQDKWLEAMMKMAEIKYGAAK